MKIFKTPLPEITLKYKVHHHQKVKIKASNDAYMLLLDIYNLDTINYIETAVVLFLNRANNTIGWMKISDGGMACTIIDAKVLFSTALQCGASSIIISHNHPSGETIPSDQDIRLTKDLVQIGKLLDLKLLDHLIVTEHKHFSFADGGML